MYSSLGAAVAGQAAAAAADLPYPELMRTRLFQPLAMTHTSIPTTTNSAVSGRSASGLPTQNWLVDGYAPAAAAVSTGHDLTLLATAILDGSAPGLGALDPMDSGDSTNTDVGGFWQVSEWNNGQTITWHNGQTSGHTAYLGLDRAAGKAVIVLSDVAREDVTDVGVRLLSQTPTPRRLLPTSTASARRPCTCSVRARAARPWSCSPGRATTPPPGASCEPGSAPTYEPVLGTTQGRAPPPAPR